jgi:monoamine oxidase
MIDGGAGSIAHKVAGALGDAVRLNSPVRSITQRVDHVLVEADGLAATARHVVVCVPPVLALEIAFEPVLPDDRSALYRAALAGPESKTLVVYDEPFWRADGFSGQSAEPNSVSEVTLDATPASGRPGVMASFTFGPVARRVDALDVRQRRGAVLDALTARFGPRAGSPTAFIETPWWTEPWTRGCSMAHFPPGIITKFGPLLRQPMGRIHWAGTETATRSHGAIDGAIRSGQRAADEILDRS